MFRALALHWIRSDEGLMLETSAFESLYSGQFTLSTQLIKPNYPEFIHSVMITVICHPLQTLLPGSSYCVTHFPFLSQVIHSDPFTAKNIYLLSITPLHTRKLILDSYHKCWCQCSVILNHKRDNSGNSTCFARNNLSMLTDDNCSLERAYTVNVDKAGLIIKLF